MDDDDNIDDQDQAEVLDETNLTRDGENIANFDDIPDVFDVTTADGDADEDEEPEDALEDDENLEDAEETGEEEDVSPLTRLEDRPEGADSFGRDTIVRRGHARSGGR
jgi:hypothetical protein